MDRCHYRFRSVWRLAAPPDAVYAVLERADEYPRWWPQVREVVPVDDTTGTARFRSLLPYDLVVTARALRRDPRARLLRALAVPGRPLFRANHALMMRAGRRGIAARLRPV
ncbi:polyketide cyclase [Streptomyces sp. SID6041]|nr:polyketide cyclase [Streptomyces sp. SID6041]